MVSSASDGVEQQELWPLQVGVQGDSYETQLYHFFLFFFSFIFISWRLTTLQLYHFLKR